MCLSYRPSKGDLTQTKSGETNPSKASPRSSLSYVCKAGILLILVAVHLYRVESLNSLSLSSTYLDYIIDAMYHMRSTMLSTNLESYVLPSTEELHRSQDMSFYGNYTDIRSCLDYSYHSNYNEQRQIFQNSLVEKMIEEHLMSDTPQQNSCSSSSSILGTSTAKSSHNPWIVFTAGAMGAGKSHSIRALHNANRFPLERFLLVDPDEIRRMLPEFEMYLNQHPELAGEKTRKEAGLIAEILTQVALNLGLNVLVDGSLRDAHWYENYFAELRRSHGGQGLRIGILHVTAPREAIFQRAQMRSEMTRRVVPQHTLEETLRQVPWSVEILAPQADFFAELHNAPHADDIQLVRMFHDRLNGNDWEAFQKVWKQQCNITHHSYEHWIEEQIEYQMIRLMSKL
jgi:hypothetical protein